MSHYLHRFLKITTIAFLALTFTSSSAPSQEETSSQTEGNQDKQIIVHTTSGDAELALAEHLRQTGAVLYGAYWCPHCNDQAAFFGQEAFSRINRIECAADGLNSQSEVCLQRGIEGYPTWEIDGELYAGTQSLDELADLSGYSGSRDFSLR